MYIFNSDLLIPDADQQQARADYPELFFALDDPVARETFRPFDERANISKTRSRRWGVFAVFLASAALLLAGGEMLYHDLPKGQVRIIAAVGGVAGIVSVVIGVFGIMFRNRKLRWLADRLATERIRQFHFQHYVAHASAILRGAGDEGEAARYRERRESDLAHFISTEMQGLDERLHHLVHAEDAGEGWIIAHQADDPVDPADPHLDQYFAAYQRLRFDQQISYCNLILREGTGFWKHAPVRQVQILGTVALAAVFFILALHGLVFVGAVANIAWMKGPLVHVLAIWAAIVALAARTFEEGFQSESEIERMRHYRVGLRRLRERFEAAGDPAGKLAAMRELEKLSYQEMVLFLRKNFEAKFVM